MSGKSRKRRSGQQQAAAQSNKFLIWAIAMAGLLVIAAAVVLLVQGGDDGGTPSDFVPEVTGAPRLALLSDTVIDHGNVSVNQYVDSVFRVQNTGDQVLTLDCDDRVQLVDGC